MGNSVWLNWVKAGILLILVYRLVLLILCVGALVILVIIKMFTAVEITIVVSHHCMLKDS